MAGPVSDGAMTYARTPGYRAGGHWHKTGMSAVPHEGSSKRDTSCSGVDHGNVDEEYGLSDCWRLAFTMKC